MVKVSDLQSVASLVTKKWAKQRKAEERDSRARRRWVYMYSDRVCQTDVACEVIPKAYLHVSNGGSLPASQRQIYYAARDEIQNRTDRQLDYSYFAQNLLRKYLHEHPETENWKVTRDSRGTFIEPHTDKAIPIGTLAIDGYLSGIRKHAVKPPEAKLPNPTYPTLGFTNRYRAILYLEKEGFNPLLQHADIAERFDIAIMSCKGQSTIAARKLIDNICHKDGIPVLVLHDFEKAGFEILQNLTSVSRASRESNRVAYEFRNKIDFIDLGLRLEDAEEWDLSSEDVHFKGSFPRNSPATDEEKLFLRGNKRVELNAFTSLQFIGFVEEKLEEHGFGERLIPPQKTFEDAFRRGVHTEYLNRKLVDMQKQTEAEAKNASIPDDLKSSIAESLREKPVRAWDDVVAEIVIKQLEDATT